jgi:hypothetical protein
MKRVLIVAGDPSGDLVASQLVTSLKELQDLQDQNQTEDFLSALYAGSVELNAGFIATANRFGWPEPGIDSTLDAKPWPEAA